MTDKQAGCDATPQESQACEARPIPWWCLQTTRWGGMTTVGPFWRIVHYVNTATRIRGWWWVQKERFYDR